MSFPEPATAAPDVRSIEAVHPQPLADVANLRDPAEFSGARLTAPRESIRAVAGEMQTRPTAQTAVGALIWKHGGRAARATTVDGRSVGEWTERDHEAGGAWSSAGSAEAPGLQRFCYWRIDLASGRYPVAVPTPQFPVSLLLFGHERRCEARCGPK